MFRAMAENPRFSIVNLGRNARRPQRKGHKNLYDRHNLRAAASQ